VNVAIRSTTAPSVSNAEVNKPGSSAKKRSRKQNGPQPTSKASSSRLSSRSDIQSETTSRSTSLQASSVQGGISARATNRSATNVNLSRYRSEPSWSSSPSASSYKQAAGDDPGVTEIKQKCYEEMKKTRREVNIWDDKRITMLRLTSFCMQLFISHNLSRPSTIFTDTQLKQMVSSRIFYELAGYFD
jgi:hypothetical protein